MTAFDEPPMTEMSLSAAVLFDVAGENHAVESSVNPRGNCMVACLYAAVSDRTHVPRCLQTSISFTNVSVRTEASYCKFNIWGPHPAGMFQGTNKPKEKKESCSFHFVSGVDELLIDASPVLPKLQGRETSDACFMDGRHARLRHPRSWRHVEIAATTAERSFALYSCRKKINHLSLVAVIIAEGCFLVDDSSQQNPRASQAGADTTVLPQTGLKCSEV